MNEYEKTLNIDFRKDFGIFYSPNILTNYIIGECLESYFSNQGFDLITLQQITILDCSCGAGAFLLETFDFLLKKYQNYFPNFPEPEKWIIENNLFGVDIDENAVEICKRQFFEKSGFEIQNIKIGNSLIEDKNIDEKAFVWKNEFPLPFKKGGFDLIVGNPPYYNIGKEHILKKSPYFALLANGITNAASLFVKLALDLSKENAIISLIIPKSFLNVTSWLPLRKILFQETLLMVSDMGKAFDEVGLEQAIFIVKKQKTPKENLVKIMKYKEFINNIAQQFFIDKSIILTHLDTKKMSVIEKIEKNTIQLSEIAEMPRGITWATELYEHQKNNTNIWILGGTNVKKYFIEDGGTRKPNRYLNKNEAIINNKKNIFDCKRIIYQNIASSLPKIVATIVKDFVTDDTINNLVLQDSNYSNEYILSLLNSKLFTFYLKYAIINNSILTVHLDKPYVGRFPIKKISLQQQNYFIEKVNKILDLYPHLQENQQIFLSLLEANFGQTKFSKKLENWFLLDMSNFIKELQKSKKGISLQTQKKWIDFFKQEQPQTKYIADQIQTLEKEIDNLVYQLYELNEEEIKIIENE